MLRIVAPAQIERVDDAAEVPGDERHVGGLDRDVGAGADRDADVGLRERRGVVDPVADHRHQPSLLLQAPDLAGLVGRAAPRRGRARSRSRAAIASAVAALSPVIIADLDPGRACSAAIAAADPGLTVSATATSPAELPSTATQHRRLALVLEVGRSGSEVGEVDPALGQQPAGADQDRAPADPRLDTLAGDRVERLGPPASGCPAPRRRRRSRRPAGARTGTPPRPPAPAADPRSEPSPATTSVSAGSPPVIVPVLSRTTVSSLCAFSSASPT